MLAPHGEAMSEASSPWPGWAWEDPMLARSRSFARRHPLGVFLTLAHGLSWLPWLWSPGGLLPAGPFLAALPPSTTGPELTRHSTPTRQLGTRGLS